MSEKKRKRHGENGERPKKKVAIAPQGNVRVQLLEKKQVLGPLLGKQSQRTQRIALQYNFGKLIAIQPKHLDSTSLRASPSTLTSEARSYPMANKPICFFNRHNTLA